MPESFLDVGSAIKASKKRLYSLIRSHSGRRTIFAATYANKLVPWKQGTVGMKRTEEDTKEPTPLRCIGSERSPAASKKRTASTAGR